VMLLSRTTSPGGLELNFAVHHLAPFALTSRLLPLLRRGAVPHGPDDAALPRVVNVNSAGHQASLAGHINPELDFDDLQSSQHYEPFLAYSRSKLANMLFTYELVRRHGDELAVAALHPGVVRTDLGRHFPRIRVAAAQALAISPKRSAHHVAALAAQPLARNGQYYDRNTPARSSPPSYDRAAAAHLWSLSEELCGPFDAPARPSLERRFLSAP
jgi:NAD(P)-dependent dehydrogenase (short-subunit alcohol dehydrogenase family)